MKSDAEKNHVKILQKAIDSGKPVADLKIPPDIIV